MSFFRTFSMAPPASMMPPMPPMPPNHYNTLGIPPSASQEDIKKAYRALSLQYHPDKNQNNPDAISKFQAIGEAYNILSDTQQRQLYDTTVLGMGMGMGMGGMGGIGFGSVPPPYSQNHPTHPSQNPFASFFSSQSSSPHQHQHSQQEMNEQILEDVFKQIIMMNAAASGFTTAYSNGNGLPFSPHSTPQRGNMSSQNQTSHNNNKTMRSPFGEGGGERREVRGRGENGTLTAPSYLHDTNDMAPPSAIQITLELTLQEVFMGAQMPIQVERNVYNPRNDVTITEYETLYVNIFRGIDDGEIITIPEKGNVVVGTTPGDVKVTIKINNTTDFKRKGLDLVYIKRITLKESLCGDFSFDLKLLNDETCTIKNKRGSIIEPNFRKTYTGMGLVRSRDDGSITTGNLIIHFMVEFPQQLSDSQIDTIANIL
jgi:DnaJ-class molecular chaperone